MNTKTFRTTIRPIFGVFLLIVMAMMFLILSTLNSELEIELEKSEQYLNLLSQDVTLKTERLRENLIKYTDVMPMDKIIYNMEMDKSVNDIFVQKSKYMFPDTKIVGVVLTDLDENKYISSSNELNGFTRTPNEEGLRWNADELGQYRFDYITSNDQRYFMIEIPFNSKDEFTKYSIGLVIEYDYLISDIFSNGEYDIHLINYKGEALMLDDDYQLLIQLQNLYGSTVFNDTPQFDRSRDNMSVKDLNYFEEHIIVSRDLDGINIILTKPYSKINIDSLQSGLMIRIIAFSILVTAVIATVIYSSQKTKRWIDSEKTFLNDIIEMDKIQISEVNKELKFYKDYFAESKLPTLFIDKESYRIINVNQAAVNYYLYSEDELTDMFLTDICKWDNDEKSDVLVVEHSKQGDEKDKRAVRLQDGLFNDSELIIMTVMSDQDLSVTSDKMKIEMFHEIRSPLQGAFGAVELIEKATSNYGEYTNIIKRSLSNVLMMTNNILAHGKISNQQAKVYETEFDLVQLIDEVTSTIVYQDKQYNLIASKVQENVNDVLVPLNSYVMTSDAIKLRQILINLMSNASKYTYDGMIHLDVDITRKDSKDILVFKVTDTGSGLSKDEIDHIYDEYTTYADNTKVTSTGIGLAITKKYVELLDSEIHISSEKGIGTTFSFSLQVVGNSTAGVPNDDQKSILIVDDDEISCDYLTHLLEQEMNCYVKTLTNETTLFTELNHNYYDCLIIDQNLNHFNGIDMIKLIKSSINKRLVDMPVILITASRTKHEFKKLSESHLDEIILKPFENDEVIQALQAIFNSDVTSKYSACKLIDPDVIDKVVLCETLESVGKEIFIELVSKFQINSREEIKQIASLFKEGSFDSISSILHRLKGSMSYFAPVKCKETVLVLEGLARNKSMAFESTLEEFIIVHEELLKELQNICRNI